MQNTTRVFISATSADLASYRKAVKEVLLTNDIHPVEQTNFSPDFRTVEDLLTEKIRSCDAVICLVGFVFGAEPTDRSLSQLRRSYTQMEYDAARRLGKPIYLFLARADCSFDNRPTEDTEKQQLQLAHLQALRNISTRWEEFSSLESLRERIAHIHFRTHSNRSRCWNNLPYVSLGSLFKGRDSFMDSLRQKLLVKLQENDITHAGDVIQRQVLCGLGGVGKTRLAVEYASRFRSEYTAQLFVVADSRESLRRNMASLTGPMVLDLTDVQQGPEEDRVAAAVRWLADHPCWCMVLDNVDTREAKKAVAELLPRLSGGHVLITSRLGESEWSHDVEPLQLDVLAPEAAKSFLLDRTERFRRRTTKDEADAEKLLRELDGLALALEQAGAFIQKQRCSIGDYLKRWKAGENRVREWSDETLTHYPNSLAVTWDTTMCAIAPEATCLLRLLSWFAPNPVPEAILSTPVAEKVIRQCLGSDAKSAAPVYLEDALIELAAFSMVRRSEDQGEPCFSLHCVVQEITRKRIPDLEWQEILRGAIELFVGYAPKDSYRFETWNTWRMLIPHAEALMAYSKGNPQQAYVNSHDKGLLRQEWNTDLLDDLALYYMGQDRYTDAIPLQRLTLDLKTERLQPDDPSLLMAKNDLALMLGSSAPEETEALYKAALEGRSRVHGEKSEEAGESFHNYAYFLGSTGRLSEAEALLQKTYSIFTELNGLFHWRTLMVEMSLARILWAMGDVETTMRMMEENLNKKKKYLDEHHTDTLHAINFLSECRMARNDLAGAEKLRREHIHGCRIGLGPRHRITLESMTSLTQLLYLQNRYEEALDLCREILEIREQLLGPDHALTLASMSNLCILLEKLNRGEESRGARVDFVERLRLSKNASPLSLRQVAGDCYSNGNYDLAELLLHRVLDLSFEVPGTRCHLARVLILMDREAEARTHVEQAWADRKNAPAYVIPRILWFQILFVYLDAMPLEEQNAPVVTSLIEFLKHTIAADNAHMIWTMDPVLSRAKCRISDEQHALLSAMVGALGERAKLPELDTFSVWRDANPKAPD